MKNFLLLVCMLLFCLGIQAQSMELIVFSVDGKAKYTATPGAKKQKLAAGATLSEDGMLKLGKKTTVGVFYDDAFLFLDGKKQTSVADIKGMAAAFREDDLVDDFSLALSDARDPYFNTVKLAPEGFAVSPGSSGSSAPTDPTPPPKKKDRDGAGNKDYAIIRLQPTGGLVTGPKLTFSWKERSKQQTDQRYTLKIKDDKGKLIFEKTVTGYELSVPREDLKLEDGASFKWEVEASENSSRKSPATEVKISSRAPVMELKQKLMTNDFYRRASAEGKLLIEAAAYEKAGFIARAGRLYEAAAKESKRSSILAENMHKSYLWKYDLVAPAPIK